MSRSAPVTSSDRPLLGHCILKRRHVGMSTPSGLDTSIAIECVGNAVDTIHIGSFPSTQKIREPRPPCEQAFMIKPNA